MLSPAFFFLAQRFDPHERPWHFMANDDTRGGWLMVAVYAVISILCWREVVRTDTSPRRSTALSRPFWIGLALYVTALGINKQLDLQTLLIELGRDFAESEGVFAYRRLIQAAFVAIAAVVGAIIAGYLWGLARRAQISERLVIAGTIASLGFVFIRAATFNHVDLVGHFLGEHRPTLALELITLLFLGFAIWQNARTRNPSVTQ